MLQAINSYSRLQSTCHRYSVTSLSLFQKYFHGNLSEKFSSLASRLHSFNRCTRFSVFLIISQLKSNISELIRPASIFAKSGKRFIDRQLEGADGSLEFLKQEQQKSISNKQENTRQRGIYYTFQSEQQSVLEHIFKDFYRDNNRHTYIVGIQIRDDSRNQ